VHLGHTDLSTNRRQREYLNTVSREVVDYEYRSNVYSSGYGRSYKGSFLASLKLYRLKKPLTLQDHAL